MKKLTKKEISEMSQEHLGLIGYVINRSFSWTGACTKEGNESSFLSFEELFQQGYFGLRKACIKFDSSLGYKFSTYAYTWIFQSIQRYIEEQGFKQMRYPSYLHSKFMKVSKMCKGSTLSAHDLLEAGDITQEDYDAYCLITGRIFVSLDAELNPDDTTHRTVVDIAVPESDGGHDEVVANDLLARISELAMHYCKRKYDDYERNHAIFMLRCQHTFNNMSLQEIAEYIGKQYSQETLTRERVRQVYAATLEYVKTQLKKEGLQLC